MAEIKVHARQIEMVPVASLKGYEKNARRHPPEQINVLANIVRDSGFTTPLLIDDDDLIIAGHGRLEVAKKLKMDEVPCVRVRDLTPEQIKALRLSDNQVGLLSSFDEALLKIELADLQGVGFDLSLTGFSSLELTGIFSTQEGHTDPDETPELPAQPVSLAGDLWRLGDHWLICGDCTNPEVVAKVLGGANPHLMVTDPPYGVEYDPAWRSTQVPQEGKWKAPNRSKGDVVNDDRADWREAWALFSGDVAYVWHADRKANVVQASLDACGFELRSQIIWRKSQFVVGRGHYHVGHEPCFYLVRKGKNGHWSGDRKQSTVWDMDHKRSETGHGTQKPVEAMARPIRNNSQPGDRVYDPFSGSGTTLIAAQMNKRVAHCIELDPKYCDVIIKRWQDFTGSVAVLADTGESFAYIASSRLDGHVL